MGSALARAAAGLLASCLLIELSGQWALHDHAFLGAIAGRSESGRRLAAMARARSSVQAGDEAISRSGAGRLTFDPQLGWRSVPGRHEAHGITFTIDQRGGRLMPPSTGPRVLLLGDSFTFGDEVSDAETWGWLLAGASGAEIIDLGVLGYGLDQVCLLADAEIPALGPAAVVVGLNSLMLIRTSLSWDTWLKPTVTVAGLRLDSDPVPRIQPPIGSLATPDLLRVWWDHLAHPIPDWHIARPRSTDLLAWLNHRIRSLGARPMLVWLPLEEDRAGESPSGGWKVFQQACTTGEWSCVDLLPAFREVPAPDLARGAHYSPAAHALVAERVARALATP